MLERKRQEPNGSELNFNLIGRNLVFIRSFKIRKRFLPSSATGFDVSDYFRQSILAKFVSLSALFFWPKFGNLILLL